MWWGSLHFKHQASRLHPRFLFFPLCTQHLKLNWAGGTSWFHKKTKLIFSLDHLSLMLSVFSWVPPPYLPTHVQYHPLSILPHTPPRDFRASRKRTATPHAFWRCVRPTRCHISVKVCELMMFLKKLELSSISHVRRWRHPDVSSLRARLKLVTE